MKAYLAASAEVMAKRRSVVDDLAKSETIVIPWGVGLEFFSLYTLAGLSRCNIPFLIDNNPAKQRRQVDGLDIRSSDVLDKLNSDAVVVITSVLHKEAMLNEIGSRSFAGNVVVLTQG
jgi:hypothetical protein